MGWLRTSRLRTAPSTMRSPWAALWGVQSHPHPASHSTTHTGLRTRDASSALGGGSQLSHWVTELCLPTGSRAPPHNCDLCPYSHQKCPRRLFSKAAQSSRAWSMFKAKDMVPFACQCLPCGLGGQWVQEVGEWARSNYRGQELSSKTQGKSDGLTRQDQQPWARFPWGNPWKGTV
jgi:hypothetical protein